MRGYFCLMAFFLLFFPLSSMMAYGSAWVSTSSREGGQYIGTYSWLSEETNGILCTYAECNVAVCHYSSAWSEMCINPSYATARILVKKGTTFKSAREMFIKKYGVSGEWATITPVLKAPDTCFGILYWQGSNDINYSGKIIPGSYCGRVPPESTVCNVLNDILFDYGELPSNVINGKKKTEFISIQCSQSASVRVTLVGERKIKLGGGIESSLYIDDKDASNAATISVPKGIKTVDVVSELSVRGNPEGGSYSGVGVLIIDYR
ncbi:TPA: exotoxin [Serratia marcescens]|nr:exotoxin [Serratia marcescens]